MNYLTTLELHKEKMKFSAGHFTIFSATEREHLHGHNYTVAVILTTQVLTNGLSFDYRFYKRKIFELCESLDHTFLLPTKSEYLTIEEDDSYYYAIFNKEKIPFPKADITFMPLCNITVEELSHWFLLKLVEDPKQLSEHHIEELIVKVYSGPGQCGCATWKKPND